MDHSAISDYMAHGFCFLWEPRLVWLHVISDIITGLAYYSIPIALFYFAYKRRDLPFHSMFVLFGVFIFSCGTTHLLAAYTVFNPRYWEEGYVKAFTAVVSGASAILFIPLLPKAIALPSLTTALDNIKELNTTLKAQLEELRIKDYALTSSINGIVFSDTAGKLTYVNNAFLEMWGYEDKKALLGQSVTEFLGAEGTVSQVFESLKLNGCWKGELNARDKDGVLFPVAVVANTIISESGEPISYMASFTDISERKRSEEALYSSERKFRDLLETIQLMAVMLDHKGRITFCNDWLLGLTGWKREEVLGKNWFDLFLPEEARGAVLEMFKAGISEGVIPMHYENLIITRDGNKKNIIWDNSLLRDTEGNVIGIASIGTDVTEHRKLEDQLRHAQKMEAVGTLAGGIAHDFNNILNVIMGFGTLAMERIGDDQSAKEHMNEVLAAAERAANLTKRLLLFSRKEVAEVKAMDVNEMIINLEKMLSRIIGEDINLVTSLMGRKVRIMADAGQLEQVLMNLATNARDAMPKGGSLAISTEVRAIDNEFVRTYGYGVPGTYAVISVTDTGAGIDREKQEMIFDPFFTTKEVGKGTGLGLSIAYGIIKQHNGYIKLYSEPGEGTTFKIWLPVIEDAAGETQVVEALPAPRGGNETVLVAEDDPSMRKLISTVLESFGYNVITAEDGEEAVAKFIENRDRINLVMLDIIMPKKSGKDAYEEIRKISPDIRALFASGYTMDAIQTHELTDQNFDFIPKPVSSRDLLKKVREILDR